MYANKLRTRIWDISHLISILFNERQKISLWQWWVYFLKIRTSLKGIQLLWTSSRRSNFPIHLESLVSFYFLFSNTHIWDANDSIAVIFWRWNIGAQYLDVHSIQTWWQSLLRSYWQNCHTINRIFLDNSKSTDSIC